MRIVFAVTVAASVLVSAPAAASTRLLDVPFVPQSELLCGGAAVSMVMRYWGAAQVYAEDFASLVDARARGIAVGALARGVEERGWRARAFAGTAGDAQAHIAEGRPLIALIEDRPGRLHYVVVVAWTSGRVVFHDPAVNPFRIVDEATFDRRWRVTGRTALLVLPDGGAKVPLTGQVGPGGDTLRERAGALFLDQRYGDAAHFAALAVDANPDDHESWQLLAASRFLEGDAAGALEAWNRRSEPRVDLPRVDGLSRTRYDVIAGALALPPHTVLTPDRLDRAARRVAAVPAVRLSRVDYSPRENGSATVNAAVVERPMLPSSRAELTATAIYAVTQREARINVSSPSGNGEVWIASARWWEGRPRVQVELAVPKLARRTGVWRIAGGWERQTYRLSTATTVESDRRHASVSFGDWASGRVRWQVGTAVDRWNGGATQLSILGELERRFAADHLAVNVASRATARFGAASVSARWRSSLDALAGWQAAGVLAAVTRTAPLDLWPGGDTGVARSTLLRAHPLLADGAIRASELQRVLPNASLEYQRRFASRPVLQVGWAAFVDATNRHVDTGLGLRVKLPASPSLLRIDVARGVRDGATALSASWQSAW